MVQTLKELIGEDLEEDFLSFDLSCIHEVLEQLNNTSAIDLQHCEYLQQLALRAADIVSDYLCKIVKTVSYLEFKLNSIKNKAALEYKDPDGNRTTLDMKKWYSECAPEVLEYQIKLSKAKASKLALDKKYDLLIKSHHHYKDMASGIRKSIVSSGPITIVEENNKYSW